MKRVQFSLEIDSQGDAFGYNPDELGEIVHAVATHLKDLGSCECGMVEFAVLDSFNETAGKATLRVDD